MITPMKAIQMVLTHLEMTIDRGNIALLSLSKTIGYLWIELSLLKSKKTAIDPVKKVNPNSKKS